MDKYTAQTEAQAEAQAEAFLASTGTTFSIAYQYHDKFFPGDEHKRDVFRFTLSRGDKSQYAALFGDSLHNTERRGFDGKGGRKKIESLGFKYYPNTADGYSRPEVAKAQKEKPSAYDVLVCLTKHDPGTFEDFCGDYGYDSDSISANRVYAAVVDGYKALSRLFTAGELEQLAEIN